MVEMGYACILGIEFQSYAVTLNENKKGAADASNKLRRQLPIRRTNALTTESRTILEILFEGLRVTLHEINMRNAPPIQC